MPHIWIESSKNIEHEPEVQALPRTVYEAALETGIFPIGGIRVRFQVIDQYIVGDGHPENAFLHIVLRIGTGRTPEVKRNAADYVFRKVCELVGPLRDRTPLAIAFELQEMSADYNYKLNNLHEHIQRRHGGE